MNQIQAIEENAISYYKGIARLLGGKYVEEEQVAWFTTGRRSLFRFNGVLHTAISSAETLSGIIDPLLEMFFSKDLPFFWVDWPVIGTKSLGAYLNSRDIRWIHIKGMPAMSRSLNDLPESSLPHEVEIIRVQNRREQADWLDVFMEGFEEPESSRPDFREFLANSIAELQPVFDHFLARWRGEPCAVSTLLRSSQCAGVYHVTALPTYRGRGLGKALTLAAMESARWKGYRDAILFATPAGLPIYQQLGFETISTADLFVWNGEVGTEISTSKNISK